jgi:undecaprenyl-diphosphatase
MVEFLYSLDLGTLYFINHTLSNPVFDKFFGLITNVNNWYIAYIILILIAFFKGGTKGKLAAAAVIVMITLTDQLSHNILKELVQRVRPCNSLPDILTPLGCTGSLSFPSNHAVNNFAAAVLFYMLYPKLKWVLFITASLVALSRVYLGLHFPSDIIGGALIGSAFGYVFGSGVMMILNRNAKAKSSHIEGLVIRKSTEKDIPVILSLIKELAAYEKLSDEVQTTAGQLKEYIFKRKIADVLIAEYKGQPAGQALFFYNFSTFVGKPGMYLEDLYVKPEFRGKGIGKELFSHLINKAKKENLGRIEWVVINWNEPAIKFYKNMGAEGKDQWTIFRLSENKF